MKYKALISFSGKVSMTKNEVKEINDDEVVKDLLQAKYIKEVKERATSKKVSK